MLQNYINTAHMVLLTERGITPSWLKVTPITHASIKHNQTNHLFKYPIIGCNQEQKKLKFKPAHVIPN